MGRHEQAFGDLIYGLVWGVVLGGLLLLQTPASHAQEGEFSLPEGWQVSPDNTKQPGEAGYQAATPKGLAMMWVPGGKFMMGSERFGSPDERPAHEVALDGFWIGRTEVTVAQWRAVMGEAPMGNDLGDDHPVVNVSWDDCQEFCERAGLSLPTEAQWEYAARGSESGEYPWGDEWDPQRACCWETQGQDERTFPVGSFPGGASWCGALDMTGNVREWCADRYGREYYQQAPRQNPSGPEAGGLRVTRGGSFLSSDLFCRSATRNPTLAAILNYTLGFRVASNVH